MSHLVVFTSASSSENGKVNAFPLRVRSEWMQGARRLTLGTFLARVCQDHFRTDAIDEGRRLGAEEGTEDGCKSWQESGNRAVSGSEPGTSQRRSVIYCCVEELGLGRV